MSGLACHVDLALGQAERQLPNLPERYKTYEKGVLAVCGFAIRRVQTLLSRRSSPRFSPVSKLPSFECDGILAGLSFPV